MNTIFDTEDGNVIIPEGTVNIESINFNYRQFKSVVIPDSVTKIEHCAFEGCSLLESVAIPESVNTISAGAFYNCTSLTTVVLPVGVAKIGKNAFADCPALSTISVPAGKADYYKKRLPQNLHQYIVEREPEKKAKK